jgi:heavy metal translocating P-type ATPase
MRVELRHRLADRLRIAVPALLARTDELHRVARWLEQRPGVRAVRVTPASASIVIELGEGAPPSTQSELLRGLAEIDAEELPSSAEPPSRAAESDERPAAFPPDRFAIASVALLASFLGGPVASASALATVYATWPTYTNAVEVWRRERRLNVDVLDALAIALTLLRGGLSTAALIAWLLRLGDVIRDRTAARSRRALDELLDFEAQQCWVVRNGVKVERSVRDLCVGDEIVVYAGSVLPVDGHIVKGLATLDQRAITGESLPVMASRGKRVYAGTVVQEGHVYVRASAVGAETTVARIVRTVRNTAVGETRAQNYAEKFADRLVAPMLAASCGLFALSGNVERLISMLIVDFGTGIRIAAPTTILASITRAARRGVLIKSGSAIERLSAVDAMIFDKTGTLTRGTPRVLDVISYRPRALPPERLLALAAAAEARHRHPVALAVIARARALLIAPPPRTQARFRIGRGVEAQVDGHEVCVGSERFLNEKGVSLRIARADLRRDSAAGCSTLLLAVDGELAGALPYADELRPEMSAVLEALRARRIREIAMITGDNAGVARAVAERLGIDRFFAGVLPQDKAELVGQFRSSGRRVGMVGDGVNDAAAMTTADVGIAVKNGTDLTRQVAQIVLMQESMWQLVTALDTAHGAIRLIRQSFAIVAGLNSLALALAIPPGLAGSGFTALMSNGSAILASLNAIRPALQAAG